MLRFFLIIIFQIFCIIGVSQQSNSTFSRNFSIFSEERIHQINSNTHSSIKPYLLSNLDSNFVIHQGSWMYRKWNKEFFLQIEKEDYSLIVNPLINLMVGIENNSDKTIWNNTRGIVADGKLGDRFTYYSSFLENQSVFPYYITNEVVGKSAWIIPGQGESRWSPDSTFDYSMASGYFTYKLSKFSVLQFGTGKNFIGDGYRSMILSDNAFNYPYLRIQTKVGIFQYTNFYMEHMDLISNPTEEYTYDKKYMSLHHLSANISDRLNIGIFESIVWENTRTPEFSGFDISYLNPIIFLRPIEYSLNSSDNALMGLNFKFKIIDKSHLYGQFVIDEFSQPALNSGDKWWGNKYAYQIGGKCYDIFGVNNLVFQIENNFARPYTYSHHNSSQNYGHYFQSLAHPLGANFNETLLFVDYKINKWELHYQFLKAKYGAKIKNDPMSYGNDIFMSNTDRPSDYGIEMFQGNKSDLFFSKITMSYLFNPKTNLKFEIGLVNRILEDEYVRNNTNFIFFALKTDLFNTYYDF
ncbi:MAG: hypothetical protein CMD02_06080 [Flavobacteriales bacterium]|nr:hypothetical protein [Flavobacteriales bacterium]